MHALKLLSNPDLSLPKIYLGLLARSGLKAYCGHFLPKTPGPIGLHEALHLLIRSIKAQGQKLAVQNHRIPVHLDATALDELLKTIDLARPLALLRDAIHPSAATA